MNSPANQFATDQNTNSALPLQAARDDSQVVSSSLRSSPEVEPPQASRPSTGRWLLMALLICCTLGSVATLAFLWLTSLPPRTNCDEISALSPDIERLSCAQEAARSGELNDLMTGLKLVESWPSEHPLHNEAQRWMEEWSKSVLIIARQKMADSDLKGAIELANRIPKSSPSYLDAQAAITKWQGNWQIDQAIYARAQDALKQQAWESVSQRILELSESPYRYWNSEKVSELSQRILVEKKARQTLAQAKRLVQTGTPQEMQAAIDLSKQMDANSYTWTEAQPVLTQWGNTLLTIGFQRWRERKLDEAIGLAKTVAAVPALSNESQNLLKLSQARQLAITSDTRWKATSKHIWNLMEATAAARQIPSDSRFYAQAQESLKSWQAQLKDTTQLQYAQVMADTGQRHLVQTAIAQAETIAPSHPRRLQAQTMIAHWRNEVERIEDRPYLLFARQVAQPGTIPALKSAIAEAGKVQMGRVLRGEAQGLIYEWTQQIQAIEDRPFLTMARLQADQGNLTEAIRAAATIRPGRALYYEAQAAIGDWQAELNRIAIARTRRDAQRNPSTSLERDTEQPDENKALQTLPWNAIPAVIDPAPQSEPQVVPPALLNAAPTQRARRAVPSVEAETDSPFVLEENTPLFEETAPPIDRRYDMDDVPRLINRGAAREQRPPASSESSSSRESAPAAVTPPQDENPFPAENLSPLFEPEAPPVSESAPPVTAPVPLVEESPAPASESSASIEAIPAAESSLLEEEPVPLSMDASKTVAPAPDVATPDPVSLLSPGMAPGMSPGKEIPLSMHQVDRKAHA